MCAGVASELCCWYTAWLLCRTLSLQLVSTTSVTARQEVQTVLMYSLPTENCFVVASDVSCCCCICCVCRTFILQYSVIVISCFMFRLTQCDYFHQRLCDVYINVNSVCEVYDFIVIRLFIVIASVAELVL